MKRIFFFSTSFIFIFIITSCNFKRFEQKKYFCENNKLDIELIDILETRSIKKSYLTIKGKEYIATIDKITDTEVLLKYVDINIKINLVSNEISATNNENIFFLKCDKSKFKI
jgi:hypothetical protein